MGEKRKKKLLYIMGIDWAWIYQRPQILALHLSECYDLTVVFPRSILNWHKQSLNREQFCQYRILWTLPLQEKNILIANVSARGNAKIFRDIYSYDAIVIGYPLYNRYIPEDYAGKIIYDCMDNYEALYPDRKNKQKIVSQETMLIARSHAIVTTGMQLYKKMDRLAPGKIRLIRNGTNIKEQSVASKAPFWPKQRQLKAKKYIIGYFGTIAEWFDYSLLLKSLEMFPDIEYQLIGPVQQSKLIYSDRIHLGGTVEHSQLENVVKNCDCLVMPFIVNEVVQWVDPVKLYEYVALGKCIISVCYEEVERFDKYAYLYKTHVEYLALIESLKSKGFPPKYTEVERTEFLKDNSWSDRFYKWDVLLGEILSSSEKTENKRMEK